jgi:hypothetical protein
MIIMWDREAVTRSVQKRRQSIIIAALKWAQLKIVSVGKDKTKGGKVKVLHTFDADGKLF